MRNSTHPLRLNSCGIASSKPILQRIMAVSTYPIIMSSKQAISPFYIKFPTHPCVWFIVEPGYFRRAYPSDKTKLKSGVALCLKDRTISTNMLTEEYPTHYIHLTKPIHCDRGYIIYKFMSDLFSHFRTPQPVKPPTNLITIPDVILWNCFHSIRHRKMIYFIKPYIR
jgi:hypothetical protein